MKEEDEIAKESKSFNNNYYKGGGGGDPSSASSSSPKMRTDSKNTHSPQSDNPHQTSTVPQSLNGGDPVEDPGGKKAHFRIGQSLKRAKGESDEESAGLTPPGQVTMTKTPQSGSSDVNHNSVNSRPSSLLLPRTSKEDHFECLADGSESFFESSGNNDHPSLQYSSRDGNGEVTTSSGGSSLPFRRNSLLRSSLRKSPQNLNSGEGGMGLHRRVGSFRNPSGTKRSPAAIPTVSSSSALAATDLYRSSSFNSSGRSSAGDVEEMYSDGSLEDEVIDLTQKYHHLEEKFTLLAENQTTVDDRYATAKQENVELSTKLFMLEESMRDGEVRGEERLREEQRRSKDAYARLEREKELQIANYEIRLQSIQKDLEVAKGEGQRVKGQLDRARTDRTLLEEKLLEADREIGNLRNDNRKLIDEARADRDALTVEKFGSQQAIFDLKREFDNLRKNPGGRGPSSKTPHRESLDGDLNELYSRLTEFEEENKRLKNENRNLQETNDDLMAQILSHGLEEGRQLLTMSHMGGMGNSLAAEFEAMSQDQRLPTATTAMPAGVVEGGEIAGEFEQMKSALKEQKEVNDQLKTYIDNILLSIVENYPQLLEVKNKCSPGQGQGEYKL